ncbi:MAG: SH3 domain-containing protein [Chloroflexota bacterium]|nr:SH3 domain-containing protein [Chloroflexota bacterium]
MTSSRLHLLTIALVLLILSVGVAAQAQEEIDPDAAITFPPSVYLLRDTIEIRGTANLPDMTGYFLSVQALDELLEPTDTEPEPIMLVQSEPVIDGVLVEWDTTTVEDGLYALVLTVLRGVEEDVTMRVTPIRVENDVPSFLPNATVLPTISMTAVSTAVPPTGPVTGTVNVASANVRTGDSTDYPVVTALFRGDNVTITGVSTRGSGWYQVQLADGRIGWMASGVLDESGDVRVLPRVQPPPVPVTRTPTPPPTPVSSADLVAGVVVLDPSLPVCLQTFTVGLDVANLGTGATFVSGTVSLIDTRAADGSVQGTTVGGFPPIAPGQTFRVVMPLTVSTFYDETHRLTLVIDPTNSVPDINRGNNVRTIEYVLQKGACP